MNFNKVVITESSIRNILGEKALEFDKLIHQEDEAFLNTICYLLLEEDKEKIGNLIKEKRKRNLTCQSVISDFKKWQKVLFQFSYQEFSNHPDTKLMRRNEDKFIQHFHDYALTIATTQWLIFTECAYKIDYTSIVRWENDVLLKTRPSYAFRPYTQIPIIDLLFPSAYCFFGLSKEELIDFNSQFSKKPVNIQKASFW